MKDKVIDCIEGYVYDIHGSKVSVKYDLKGEQHKATFDIKIFKKYNADFVGARIDLLTVEAADSKNPYDLVIRLKDTQPLQKLSTRVQEQLRQLEDLEHDG